MWLFENIKEREEKEKKTEEGKKKGEEKEVQDFINFL